MLELMAELSAKDPSTGALAWVRRGGPSAPSPASRVLLALGGICAVLGVLLAMMWLTGLLL